MCIITMIIILMREAWIGAKQRYPDPRNQT